MRSWLAGFPDTNPLVVMTIYNAYEDAIECVESLLSTTASDVPVLLLDDASPDTRLVNTLAPLAEANGMLYLRKSTNRGIVDSANFAFSASAPRDVIILNSDIVLPPDWLPRLREAAYSRANIATVTPLTNNGVLYSVPYRNQPTEHLVKGMTPEQIDERVRRASMRARPIVPTCITFCTYFRRTALDAVGPYDTAFSPGYGEEVDFSQRATTMGLNNIVADDLFVFHKGSRSFGTNERKRRIQDSHEAIIDHRYPWHKKQVREAELMIHNPLFMVVDRVRGSVLGNRIGIDATCVNNDHVTGTQIGTLELIRALATAERDYTLSIVVRDDVLPKALKGVDGLVDRVMTVSEIERVSTPPFDIIHRPYQVMRAEELRRLRHWGMRFAVTHLDSIAFSNPRYAEDTDEWLALRQLTRLTFHLADGVAFISQDAADDARQRGLIIPPERSEVVYFGVDHDRDVEPKEPPSRRALTDRPFLLMLGTNFLHKNRVFAIRLLKALSTQYGWDGNLVFAGPKVGTGSSSEPEAYERLLSREMASRVIELGNVSDAEKVWLLRHAALLVYPSIAEGFGIPPFEAAAFGTPALTTRFASLGEIVGENARYFNSLDADREAPTAWALLSDPEAAARQIAAINERAPLYSWSSVAARVDNFYRRIAAMIPRSRTIDDFESILAEHDYHRLEEQYTQAIEEYARLEKWAKDLDQRVRSTQSKPLYGVLSKLGIV